MDVQVIFHTDTGNESGFVENTPAAIRGRTLHAIPAEGAGGGDAPTALIFPPAGRKLRSASNATAPH